MNDFDRMFRDTFTRQKIGNSIVITAENEFEEKLLAGLEQTIDNSTTKLETKHPNQVKATGAITRKIDTLENCCEKFLVTQSRLVSKKVMYKYKQAVDYLYVYFNKKINIKDITTLEAHEFREFLLEVPIRYKTQKDLKDKDIKLLIQMNSKLLEQYPKQGLRTTDEVIVKSKTIFALFQEKNYIHINPFEKFKKLAKKKVKNTDTEWIEYKYPQFIEIYNHMKDNEQFEEQRFIKFLLMTGLRRGEAIGIKIEDIDFKKNYITVYGTKTDNAKRIMPIQKYLLKEIKKQVENKASNDFLFFDKPLNKYNKVIVGNARAEHIGKEVNAIIKEVVGEEKKKNLNIHSFRKNFMQIIFISDNFNELEMDTLNGHANNSTLDIHYLRGLRDYKKLNEKMNKVDFTDYFEEKLEDIFEEEELEFSF